MSLNTKPDVKVNPQLRLVVLCLHKVNVLSTKHLYYPIPLSAMSLMISQNQLGENLHSYNFTERSTLTGETVL